MSTYDWVRVSRGRPCPVCGRPDWCLVDREHRAAICARTESPWRRGEKGAGWWHPLQPWRPASRAHRVTLTVPRGAPPPDFEALAVRWTTALTSAMFERLAAGLGVSADSLRRLRVGWSPEYGGAYSFPMRGPDGRICGIRLRLPTGRKLSVRGGREGLFAPRDLPSDGPLLIAEGPTDTAALLSLGFAAIGRPSCSGGVRLCRDVARGRDVIVVADGDEPGQRGAAVLARALAAYCPSVRVIRPPAGVKDMRAWLQRGANAADVLAAVQAAAPVRVRLRAEVLT